MAHFYSRLKGGRKEVTRTGTKNSGITSNISGWDIGVITELHYDSETKEDYFLVFATKGSNNPTKELIIDSRKLVKL